MALVTLQQAKDHLRLTTTDGDADLTLKLAQAQALVVDYCNTTEHWRTVTADWNSATVPPVVTAAILVQLGELDRFRGDDTDGPRRVGPDDLAVMVRELLRRSRDPVIA